MDTNAYAVMEMEKINRVCETRVREIAESIKTNGWVVALS